MQELPSMLEVYRQQVKKTWPQLTDKLYYPFQPGDWIYDNVSRRKHLLLPAWERFMRYC